MRMSPVRPTKMNISQIIYYKKKFKNLISWKITDHVSWYTSLAEAVISWTNFAAFFWYLHRRTPLKQSSTCSKSKYISGNQKHATMRLKPFYIKRKRVQCTPQQMQDSFFHGCCRALFFFFLRHYFPYTSRHCLVLKSQLYSHIVKQVSGLN